MDLATAFFLWLQSQNIPVVGVSNPDNISANMRIDYAPSATPEQRARADAAKLVFVAPPAPDPNSFINKINSDPLVSGQPLLFQLGANLLPIFQNDMQTANISALKQHWSDVKAVFGSTWLTPSVQQMILTHASECNISLE